MENLNISYSAISEILFDCNKDVDIAVGVITTNRCIEADSIKQQVRLFLTKSFLPKFKTRLNKCRREKARFFRENEEWLSQVFVVKENVIVNLQAGKRGRPSISFEESQERAKRAKVQELCLNTSEDLIISAARRFEKNDEMKCFTPEKALSLILDAALSKHQYEVLRSSAKQIGCDIFPSYKKVLLAKKECYPEDLEVSENYSKVGLQELLDHTATRILKAKLKNNEDEIPMELQLISKWGCDGSSGHSEYHQKFSNENDSDKYMFLTSFVPLNLSEHSNNANVCWKNTEHSSTRFCRPIKFEFVKETADVIKSEVDRVTKEIENLRETIVEMENKRFKISHSLSLTMIDRKVATTIMGSSSMAVCFICGAKPTEFNDLEALVLRSNSVQSLKFGISPLHARIKFMECILHIAYNKSFSAWRTNKDTREQKAATKAHIQEKFKTILGIKVDVVKQGMGSTNDGNVARRFFENPSVTADITGVNENLINRFKTILTTINCSKAIAVEKFQEYCLDTAKLYVELYSWYYMPVTVHKVLMHGSKIVAEAILPIGMLSEEAQEARNKDYRNYRLYHARKSSRINTNEDVFHHLLMSSDPYINLFRTKLKIKKLDYDQEVKDLLLD